MILSLLNKAKPLEKVKRFINQPKKLSHALGRFFDSGDYGPEMVQLLRNVLVGEKISIAGKFKSDLLGKEVSIAKGETVPWSDPTATHISRSFDSYELILKEFNQQV